MLETAPSRAPSYFWPAGRQIISGTRAHVIHRDFFSISADRREGIQRVAHELQAGRRIALSTHINADGDGCGSEAGLARMLAQRGMAVHIVDPTAGPDLFDFLPAY